MARGKHHEWITEDGLLLIESWARDGLTDADIAHNIGIMRPTLYTWIKKFPKIKAALKKGKAPVDAKVENAMFRRATGEWVEETETTIEKIGDSGIPLTRITKKKRYIPPDTVAGIFWLKNRKPNQWQRASEAEYKKLMLEAKKYEIEVEKLHRELREKEEKKGSKIVIIDEWSKDNDNKED